MLVYLAMAIDFSLWAIKVTDKIGNGFSWRGKKDAKGSHYSSLENSGFMGFVSSKPLAGLLR